MLVRTREFYQDNFWWAEKPHRPQGAPDPSTRIPLHALMAPGATHIPPGTVGTRDHRAEPWETDLAPVRMATEVEIDATRLRLYYQLWRVHQQDFKHLLRDAMESAWEVITAIVMRIVQANEPDGVTPMPDWVGLIHQHGDAQTFEYGHLLERVMIAQHPDNAIAGVDRGQNFLHMRIDIMAWPAGLIAIVPGQHAYVYLEVLQPPA